MFGTPRQRWCRTARRCRSRPTRWPSARWCRPSTTKACATLRGTRPHFVITDHDTGHNGPLFSVAARLALADHGAAAFSYVHRRDPAFAERARDRGATASPRRRARCGAKVRTVGTSSARWRSAAARAPPPRSACSSTRWRARASWGLRRRRASTALALQCAAHGAQLIDVPQAQQRRPAHGRERALAAGRDAAGRARHEDRAIANAPTCASATASRPPPASSSSPPART